MDETTKSTDGERIERIVIFTGITLCTVGTIFFITAVLTSITAALLTVAALIVLYMLAHRFVIPNLMLRRNSGFYAAGGRVVVPDDVTLTPEEARAFDAIRNAYDRS